MFSAPPAAADLRARRVRRAAARAPAAAVAAAAPARAPAPPVRTSWRSRGDALAFRSCLRLGSV